MSPLFSSFPMLNYNNFIGVTHSFVLQIRMGKLWKSATALSRKPGTLILICGLPGAGKTTLAKELEQKYPLVRFSPDDWIAEILEDHRNIRELDRLRDPVESLLWEHAKKLLTLGLNVILEYGFWTRDERDKFRDEAKALGARVELVYVHASKEILWYRIEKRNANLPRGNFHITKDNIDDWWNKFEVPTEEELLLYDKNSFIG